MAIKYLSKAKRSSLAGAGLLRLDFNTKDDWRMRAVLPTIKFLLKNGDTLVAISHRGRPNGADKKFSLKKDAAELSKLIGRKVTFIPHFRWEEIRDEVARTPHGAVFLLENLRFLKGEEANDAKLAKSLASIADYYVNDAFAVSHRANASVAAITKFLPSYAGFELEREIVSLSRVMKSPKRPLAVILGGAKAKDKLGVITFFKSRADTLLLGGGPANTILSMKGVDVKNSIRDKEPKDIKAMQPYEKLKKVTLPVDFVWHKDMIWDLGPKSVQAFTAKINAARTILWSGPLGLFEKPRFAKGSVAVARAIAKNRRAFSVAGGGETVMFLKKYKLDRKFSFISTGGGAMMDFLAGKKLPGIKALE